MNSFDELKTFIEQMLGNVSKEITLLRSVVDRVDASLRTVELNSSTRLASLQTQVNALEEQMDEIKRFSNLEKLEGTMQMADIALANRLTKLEESQKFKWNELHKKEEQEIKDFQDLKNDIKDLTKLSKNLTQLLWIVIGVVTTTIVAGALNYILKGGLSMLAK